MGEEVDETFELDTDDNHDVQISHRYQLGCSISTAWLSHSVSSEQIKAKADGWDLLVVHAEWRRWVREYMIDASPFLYLAVRDGLDRRRLLKTKSGVSMHLPVEELLAADRAGVLAAFFATVIRDIYAKWAQCVGAPPPPPLPMLA